MTSKYSDSPATELNVNFNEKASSPTAPLTQTHQTGLSGKLVLFLAIACGLSVANLYYCQPLLVTIGHEFKVSDGEAGIISTLSQVGYALGLLFIVPLGDAMERRSLIFRASLAVALALLGVAVAPNFIWLSIVITLVGITTVVPQLIVPLAASMAKPSERGRVIGNVMSGLLVGILLSRTISGYINAWLGWRAVYFLALGLMLFLAFVLRQVLPHSPPKTNLRYGELLTSLAHLIKTEPVLRETAVLGGLAFGALSSFWVTLTFLLSGAPYHYSSDIIGLFGLLGVAGALMALVVGKLSDIINPRIITGVALVLSLAGFILAWAGSQFLSALIAAVILLDLGTQGIQITNQNRIYSLKSEAGSRLNTVYMVSYFAGGSLGSFLGVTGWSLLGWNGVGMVGVGMLALALVIYGLDLNGSMWRRRS